MSKYVFIIKEHRCAKAFGNWSRRSNLRQKESREGPFDPPPPSLRNLGLMNNHGTTVQLIDGIGLTLFDSI